jgi:hypothetical protein
MRTSKELAEQIVFVNARMHIHMDMRDILVGEQLIADLEEKRGELVDYALSKWLPEKGCLEGVQANGLPKGMEAGELYIQPSGTKDCKTSSPVQGLPADSKQLHDEADLVIVRQISRLIRSGNEEDWTEDEKQFVRDSYEHSFIIYFSLHDQEEMTRLLGD